MEIRNFEDLLTAAKQQPQPQRLLFVFVKAVLPKDADPEEVQRFQAGSGGGLQPQMSVDKRPEELASFASLVAEADARSADWGLVFVAALGGQGGNPPSVQAADSTLELMINTIQSGGDISRYLVFDRQGQPLAITRS